MLLKANVVLLVNGVLNTAAGCKHKQAAHENSCLGLERYRYWVLDIGQYLPVLGSTGIGEYLTVFILNTQG